VTDDDEMPDSLSATRDRCGLCKTHLEAQSTQLLLIVSLEMKLENFSAIAGLDTFFHTTSPLLLT
jgi:hypothetical protein